MNGRKTPIRSLAALAAVLLLALGAWWYLSPYYTVYRMTQDAQARDSQAVNARIDYPAVRESLKRQLSARMAVAPADPGNPFAAWGAALGRALVGPMVDVLVQPQTLMLAMQTGHLPMPKEPSGAAGAAPATQGGTTKPKWRYVREGVDRMVIYPNDADPSDDTGLVFVRSGFATWRLSEIVLPAR